MCSPWSSFRVQHVKKPGWVADVHAVGAIRILDAAKVVVAVAVVVVVVEAEQVLADVGVERGFSFTVWAFRKQLKCFFILR